MSRRPDILGHALSAQDGYDVVEWLARQSWSSGKIAMWGGLYAGFDQWATLKERPPHLATVVPVASVYPARDFPFEHGIFYSYDKQWLTFTSGDALQLEQFGDNDFWNNKFNDYYFGHEPFNTLDKIAGNTSTAFQTWLEHPTPDAWWDSMVPTPLQYAQMNVPVLNITGQFDGDQLGALTYYHNFMQYATAQERARYYLIIGPWDHPGTRTPRLETGGLTFGAASKLDMNDLHRQWYDWTMKNGRKPAFLRNHVAYWVTGAEQWRYADSLEAITPSTLRYTLGSNGKASDAFHSGILDVRRQDSGTYDAWTNDPLDTRFGRQNDADQVANYLEDQTGAMDLLGAGAVYTSPLFTRDVTLAGSPRMVAYISADVPDTDLICYLYQIMPDGTSVALSNDILRARYRNSDREPQFLTPGKVERMEFKTFSWFARRIAKGSRLRLVIASINSQNFEKNYNTAGNVANESRKDARTAHIRLYHTANYPSFLEIGQAQP